MEKDRPEKFNQWEYRSFKQVCFSFPSLFFVYRIISYPSFLFRYGPWSLLCKNRYAPFTVKRQHGSHIFDHNIEDWIEYADNSTVESFGLSNGSHIMMEFALISKSDTL